MPHHPRIQEYKIFTVITTSLILISLSILDFNCTSTLKNGQRHVSFPTKPTGDWKRWATKVGCHKKLVYNAFLRRDLINREQKSTKARRANSFISHKNRIDLGPHVPSSEEREQFWNVYQQLNDFKKAPLYQMIQNNFTNAGQNVTFPILSSFHYLIIPVRWEEENNLSIVQKQNLEDHISQVMNFAIDYFREMSWDQFELSYEFISPQHINISQKEPLLIETKDEVYERLGQLGHTQGDGSFDGIMILHTKSEMGPLSTPGGRAYTNDNILWMTNNVKFTVTRHEVGHNFGHWHHLSMNGYRNLLDCPSCQKHDGFDMMSGGNKYQNSHFALASKWFYQWVPDSSIVMMQPEGSTKECPSCVNHGSYLLKPFDQYNLPPNHEFIMGIKIPLLGQNNDETKSMFSYWLSYRSGVDGYASIGLSVHLVWFDLGGLFGSYYDSLSYDIHGDTESLFDSFVLPGTCYVIEPNLKLLDMGFHSVKDILPKVCVDSLIYGEEIQVSVSFLNETHIEREWIDLDIVKDEITCAADNTTQVNTTLTLESPYLIKMSGAGDRSTVSAILCTNNDFNVTGYLYDRYPYASLALGAPYGYSSFASFSSGRNCSCLDSLCNECDVKELDFWQTKLEDAWLLVVLPLNETITIHIQVQCHLKICSKNQYLLNGRCQSCPHGVSLPGSSSVSQCISCPGGYEPSLTRQLRCDISERYDVNIMSSRAWRIWVPGDHVANPSALNVSSISLYSSWDCIRNKIEPIGRFLDSGNAGTISAPQNAFYDLAKWRGRPDRHGDFWLGIIFDNSTDISCINVNITDGNYLEEMRVQAYVEGRWENVWIEDNVAHGGKDIGWNEGTYSPSTVPSIEPSVASSIKPSSKPTFIPSLKPSFLPSTEPSLKPSLGPSLQPSLWPTNFPSYNPSHFPSLKPSLIPSMHPSVTPSQLPSSSPSLMPSKVPTDQPSLRPSISPTRSPISKPSTFPTVNPSIGPSTRPSFTALPSFQPSSSSSPSLSFAPSFVPTSKRTLKPSNTPTKTNSIEFGNETVGIIVWIIIQIENFLP